MPFKCVVPGCRSNYYHVKGTPSIPMMRFPKDPELKEKWKKAIHRVDFEPTPHSHVCIKHFSDDCLQWQDGGGPWVESERKVRRRSAALAPHAVPSVFEVDPSKHVVRHYPRTGSKLKKKEPKAAADSGIGRCEILAGYQVKFKPEMWEDGSTKEEEKASLPGTQAPKHALPTSTTLTPVKRRRGRPRKHPVVVATKQKSQPSDKTDFISCCALACTNTSELYSMNCLPRDKALRQIWVEKIDRLDWTPDEDSALCEIHFEPDMWESNVGEEKILKLDAVPSLFLHGEAIKSWVTMDNSGNVENIVVGKQGCEGDLQDSEEDDAELCIKREVLEPEIDMIEGVEDVLSQEASSSEEHFETIYCDSTYSEQMEGGQPSIRDYENPLHYYESDITPLLQDEEVSCIDDSSDDLRRRPDPLKSNFFVISRPDYLKRKIKRRSSAELSNEYKCPLCNKKLSRQKNLDIHMEKLHPNGEISEYHQKKKKRFKEPASSEGKESILKTQLQFKKPPPGLNPIVPKSLLPSLKSSALPNVPALTPIVATSLSSATLNGLVASPSISANSLLATSTVVASPSPNEPSPTGSEVKKQFLLILPTSPSTPLTNAGLPTLPITPTLMSMPADETKFTVNLASVPEKRREVLKEKLTELVDAVVKKNLNPEKIIIAYDRTLASK